MKGMGHANASTNCDIITPQRVLTKTESAGLVLLCFAFAKH